MLAAIMLEYSDIQSAAEMSDKASCSVVGLQISDEIKAEGVKLTAQGDVLYSEQLVSCGVHSVVLHCQNGPCFTRARQHAIYLTTLPHAKNGSAASCCI